MVSSLHLFRRDSAVSTPVLPARISADSTASRSIGMAPILPAPCLGIPCGTHSIPAVHTFSARTASVLCAAKASALESSQALARFPASLQILSASGSFFAVTTMATSSAKPMSHAPSGMMILRIPSYITFHNKGPKTDPWGTPPLTLWVDCPESVSYRSKRPS